MTAPSGPILFNSSTGSDTAASGLGPATALTGAGASTTAASVTVTGIDTTGVSVGDLLWVSSSSGRQFSIIATIIDGTSVTCDNTFANTEASRTWAIGGKRATLDNTNSRLLFSADLQEGWVVTVETNQSLTSELAINYPASLTRRFVLQGDDSGARPILTWSHAGNGLSLGATASVGIHVDYLDLQNSNAASSIAVSPNTNECLLTRLKIDHPTDEWNIGVFNLSNRLGINIFECSIRNCRSHGIQLSQSTNTIAKCSIIGNGGSGVFYNASRSTQTVIECVIASNAGEGIFNDAGGTGHNFSNNIIYGNGASGIRVDAGFDNTRIVGNILSRNGSRGLDFGGVEGALAYCNYNAYDSNTVGLRNGSVAGPDDITLTADPFTWSKTLTAVSWTFATKRLNKTAGFAGVHVGQSVNVTGGTGVTPGLYEIASVDSNDQITLVASIAGSDQTDVTTAPDFNINNHAGGGAALRAATVVLT